MAADQGPAERTPPGRGCISVTRRALAWKRPRPSRTESARCVALEHASRIAVRAVATRRSDGPRTMVADLRSARDFPRCRPPRSSAARGSLKGSVDARVRDRDSSRPRGRRAPVSRSRARPGHRMRGALKGAPGAGPNPQAPPELPSSGLLEGAVQLGARPLPATTSSGNIIMNPRARRRPATARAGTPGGSRPRAQASLGRCGPGRRPPDAGNSTRTSSRNRGRRSSACHAPDAGGSARRSRPGVTLVHRPRPPELRDLLSGVGERALDEPPFAALAGKAFRPRLRARNPVKPDGVRGPWHVPARTRRASRISTLDARSGGPTAPPSTRGSRT